MAEKMKVYFLDLGYSPCDLNMLANVFEDKPHVDKSTCYAILIDHPKAGKILIDAGFHPDAMYGRWAKHAPFRVETFPYVNTAKQTIEYQLALCDTRPEEINTIILSHIHEDHTGCLYRFEHATIYMNDKEFANPKAVDWLLADEEERRNMPAYSELGIPMNMAIPNNKYAFIHDDCELFEGVKIIQLPGHTMGQIGVVLELEHNTLVYTTDAAFLRENYGPPAVAPGKTADYEAAMNSIEKIRSIVTEKNATICYGHDQGVFESLKHAPEYYD